MSLCIFVNINENDIDFFLRILSSDNANTELDGATNQRAGNEHCVGGTSERIRQHRARGLLHRLLQFCLLFIGTYLLINCI